MRQSMFLLIAHTDDRELIITSFDTYEARKIATDEEMGEPLTEQEEEELKEEGILSFEGDPPIEWRMGYIAPGSQPAENK